MPDYPARVRVHIEVPRLSFVKRELGGGVDFVSPLPSPWNYGCVPRIRAPDGDPLDALVLGPRLARGAEIDVDVHGVVRFEDGGATDDKLICAHAAPSAGQYARITAFFLFYARARRILDRVRGRAGSTRFLGLAPRGG